MNVHIVLGEEKYLVGFHQCLDVVAREKIYIEMIEAKPFEEVAEFQRKLFSAQGPSYYAVERFAEGERVVGWCDIFPKDNPRQKHRGVLGMGLIPEFRGKGIGSRLMTQTLAHAKEFGLEKIELQVYTTNSAALALYKKFGFFEEGVVKHYRKLDGKYFDSISMAKFL